MTSVCIDPDDFETDDSGRLVLKLACGLEHSADGIKAGVAAWPYDCAIGTAGGPIYCDPATGKLHGPPTAKAYFLDAESVNVTTDPDDVVGPTGQRTETVTFNIDTNAECETLIAQFQVQSIYRVTFGDNDHFAVATNRSYEGSPFAQWAVFADHDNLLAATWAEEKEARTDHLVLPPGDIYTVRYQTEFTNLGASNLILNKIGVRVRGLVMTQRT